MSLPPLISAEELLTLPASDYLLFDVRFDLMDAEAGRNAYVAGHLPDAHFVDLEGDLSGPIGDASNGRHPLPAADALAASLARLGVGNNTRVIAYDAGANVYPARLWWSLRYLGHDNVQVLDGGVSAWTAAGGQLTTTVPPAPEPGDLDASPRADMVVGIDEVLDARLLVDSREAPRYRGETEPVDPVAGHIPGAVNHFFGQNLNSGKGFRPVAELRAELQAMLGDTPVEEAVIYCGSGVSACNNLLALAHAGLGMARLYPGSWSEWCRSPGRPIHTTP